MKLLVIRLSALGDVALCLPALRALAADPAVQLHVLTRAPYARLISAAGPTRVWVADAPGRACSALVGQRFDRIVDLQGGLKGLRARWAPSGRAEVAPRRSLSRRWAAWRHDSSGGGQPPRFMDVAAALGVTPQLEPMEVGAPRASGAAEVALCPGASLSTKRYPLAGWVQVAEALAARGALLRWVGGHADRDLLEAASRAAGGQVIAGGDALDLARVLAGVALTLASDSGAAHISELVGTPVVMVFGPTVPGFGFGPRLACSKVVQLPLQCRPCSPHGGPRCPLGHHSCLQALPAAALVEAAVAALDCLKADGLV